MATKGEDRKSLRKKKRVGPTSDDEGEAEEPFFNFKRKKEEKKKKDEEDEEGEEEEEVQEIPSTQAMSPSILPAPSDEEEEEEGDGPPLRPLKRGEGGRERKGAKKEKFLRKYDCGERLFLGNNHFLSYQEEHWEGYTFSKICVERAYVSSEGKLCHMMSGCPTTYSTQLLGQLLVLMRRLDPEALCDWLEHEKTKYVNSFLIPSDRNAIYSLYFQTFS